MNGAACATGVARTQGHRIDSVVRFERAASDGTHLWVTYLSEVRDRRGERHGERSYGAVVALSALDPEAPIAVEAFPIELVSAHDIEWGELDEIPLSLAGAGPDRNGRSAIVVLDEAGRAAGLRLVGVRGSPAGAVLRSAALTRTRYAPWTYAALVPAALWDLFWVPQLLFFGFPLFSWTQ